MRHYCDCIITTSERDLFIYRRDPDWYSCVACDGRVRPITSNEHWTVRHLATNHLLKILEDRWDWEITITYMLDNNQAIAGYTITHPDPDGPNTTNNYTGWINTHTNTLNEAITIANEKRKYIK